MLRYTSDKGYNYRQLRDGSITRVSISQVDTSINRPPKIGDRVKIIIKPYNEKKYIVGVVDRVLTRKKIHSRGHKVRLTTGVVGRIIHIFDKK